MIEDSLHSWGNSNFVLRNGRISHDQIERDEVAHPFLKQEGNLDPLNFLKFETERPEDLIGNLRHHISRRSDRYTKEGLTFLTVKLEMIKSNALSFNSCSPSLSARR